MYILIKIKISLWCRWTQNGYPPKQVESDNSTTYVMRSEAKEHFARCNLPSRISIGWINLWLRVNRCYNAVKETEGLHTKTYAAIIRSRPDIYYLKEINSSILLREVVRRNNKEAQKRKAAKPKTFIAPNRFVHNAGEINDWMCACVREDCDSFFIGQSDKYWHPQCETNKQEATASKILVKSVMWQPSPELFPVALARNRDSPMVKKHTVPKSAAAAVVRENMTDAARETFLSCKRISVVRALFAPCVREQMKINAAEGRLINNTYERVKKYEVW